jgi:hypothetical protein
MTCAGDRWQLNSNIIALLTPPTWRGGLVGLPYVWLGFCDGACIMVMAPKIAPPLSILCLHIVYYTLVHTSMHCFKKSGGRLGATFNKPVSQHYLSTRIFIQIKLRGGGVKQHI